MANTEGQVPVYNSADEIPIYEKRHVQQIDFDGLPKFNVIWLFANYIMNVKDSYPEFAWQNGIAILSALVRRRMYIKMNGEFTYLNIWTLSLGQSGYARKSGSMGIGRRNLTNAISGILLPEDTSPEGLIEAMATTIKVPNKQKDGTKTMESIEMEQEGEIPFSQRSLWKDEAGQLYAGMQKAHMQGIGELFCKLHGCPNEYYKKLTSKSIVIENAYFSMNLATTPASFMRHMTDDNINTGFGTRHLIVAPSYIKSRKPLKEDSDRDSDLEVIITKSIKVIDSVIPEGGLRIRFQDGVLEAIDEWAAEREEFFAKTKDEKMSSFFAKYQTDTIRIAALIELGNIPYYLAVNDWKGGEFHINDTYKDDGNDYLELINSLPEEINYQLSKLNISLASAQYALKLMDSMYLPYIANLNFNDEKNGRHNDVQKFYTLLEKEKKMNRSILLKKLGVSSDKLETIQLDGLVAGHIEVCTVKTKTKPQTWYVYKPTDETKFGFQVDYSNVQIEEFKPDMKMKFAAPKDIDLDSMNEIERSETIDWEISA